MALSHLKCPLCRSVLRRESIVGREAFVCANLSCLGHINPTPTAFTLQNGKLARDRALERVLLVQIERQARMDRDG